MIKVQNNICRILTLRVYVCVCVYIHQSDQRGQSSQCSLPIHTCVRMCEWCMSMSQHIYGGQRITFGGQFSPSTFTWILRSSVVRIVWQELTPAEPPHQPNIAYSTSITILLQTDVLVYVCGVYMYIHMCI